MKKYYIVNKNGENHFYINLRDEKNKKKINSSKNEEEVSLELLFDLSKSER